MRRLLLAFWLASTGFSPVKETPLPTFPCLDTSGIERELAAMVAEGHTLGSLNLPALLAAPGVVVDRDTLRAIESGLVPLAVQSSGYLIFWCDRE